ncbi:circularly permuted type 2 ATP-grasp protein [Sphingobium sp. CR28]|uniref:circularly permuted type 2 ATP-grasp protein n=1 Tax=Sphingobium sp. CR28 TaxID=3400272 RepID=UPI003FF07A16
MIDRLTDVTDAFAVTDRLRDYPTDVDAGDLFRHASGAMAEKWLMMAKGLDALAEDAAIPMQELVSRQIQDLGMSFRITGDAEEREWPLNPVPLLIGAEEWSVVEQGLIQRARLLETVVTDVYGQQKLVAGGQLPAAMVTGSRFFARNMVGLRPGGNTYLHVYAADLARGPMGQWRIIGDRLRLANGIGYALENRIALSRGTGTLLADLNTRRLAQFFSELREGIARECQRENPRIAFLTPGRFNQSYPEQAHLARYLGFPLVEGRDLTVDEDRLYVRTIAGPKRVDAVWRWIDTNALDPLSFDARSAIGVPDLFDAFARGGLEIANWPGVELLEAPAFAAFLPRLCRTLLGEEPILPNIATWWCGQPTEAQTVRARLDELVIQSAFGGEVEGVVKGEARPGRDFSDIERKTLLEAMDRRPMDYCAQEIVRLSTTPALIDERFQPRAFTVRAFVARGSDGLWTVMPGGFARLSSSGEMSTTLMGEGDISADVCVVDGPGIVQMGQTVLGGTPEIRRGGGILASQPADNLFWFGRYCERAEMTVRIIRSILGSSIEVDAASGRAPEVRALLVALLRQWGAVAASDMSLGTAQICRAALSEGSAPSGVPALLNRVRQNGLSLRDRFALDFWRIASRPAPALQSDRPGLLLRAARDLIERFSALSGLVAEDMVQGPVRHFLEMGRRIERAIGTCRVVRQLAQGSNEPDALNVLLDLSDSQITYRTRYLSGAMRDPVYDLVLLDPDNPRSLLFQIEALNRHLEAQPRLTEGNLPEQPLREARAALAPFLGLSVADFDLALIDTTESRLLALSEAISARFFLPYERPQSVIRSSTIG